MAMIELVNGTLNATIDSDDGMNVISLKYRDVELVEFDQTRKDAGRAYAIPVLFPTPNRTKDGYYEFDGFKVPATQHGFARKTPFTIVSKEPSCVVSQAHFEKTEEFPYDIIFTVKISLEENKARWDFNIDNRSGNRFPFGLALHPFFRKDAFTGVSSTLKKSMLMDESYLPTGVTEDADFSEIAPLKTLNVNCVFLSDECIVSRLENDDFSMTIKGSEEFNHVVLYTGTDFSFICVEPQTCSTDFINLHKRGFEKEANMLIVEGGEKRDLSIEFIFG